MIRDQLTPIRIGATISVEEIGQAIALSYLSYYSSQVAQPRVITAYRRAWAMDFIKFFNSTTSFLTSNTPGFCVSVWNSGGFRRLQIAIQGLSDWRQITRHDWNQPNPMVAIARLDGVPGVTIEVYKRHAGFIWAAIMADPDLAAVVADRRTVITFCGHSLGAAIADVMSVIRKVAEPWRRVRLVKLASPRVGDQAYVTDSAEGIVETNVYCERDPIHWFPEWAPGITIGASWNPLNTWQRPLSRDPYCVRIHPFGAGYNLGYRYDGILNWVSAVASAINPPYDPENAWYDHFMGSYRLAFMQLAASVRDTLMLRFNYLEHNDENTWQTAFTPGAEDWRAWNVLNPDAPPEQVPLGASQASSISRPPEAQAVVPQPPVDASSENSVGVVGEWSGGYQPPVFLMPSRRVRASRVR